MKKILICVGTRPNFIKVTQFKKLGPEFNLDISLLHTGQHFDHQMSQVFFDELKLDKPDIYLDAQGNTQIEMMADIMCKFEKELLSLNPDFVLVPGDVNSSLACAIVSSRNGYKVGHIESGLRSFDRDMPEEINRISCDHMSSLLFSPTLQGIENLKKEGFNTNIDGKATMDTPHIYHCGDVMLDNSMHFAKQATNDEKLLEKLNLSPQHYILCTIHRDNNTDISAHLKNILLALIDCQKETKMKIVLPLHPRTKGKIEQLEDQDLVHEIVNNPNILILPPAGFKDIITLEKNSRLIITDSGGLQKEAYFFKKPCVILREQTEWVEIVNNGNAILTGADYDKIKKALHTLLNKTDFTYPELFGDGLAGKFICSKILSDL